MYERFITLAVIALLLSGSTAFAQCGCTARRCIGRAELLHLLCSRGGGLYAGAVCQLLCSGGGSRVLRQLLCAGSGPCALRHILCAARALRDVLFTPRDVCPGRGALRGLLRPAGLEHLRGAASLRAWRTRAEYFESNHAVEPVHPTEKHGLARQPVRSTAWSSSCGRLGRRRRSATKRGWA